MLAFECYQINQVYVQGQTVGTSNSGTNSLKKYIVYNRIIYKMASLIELRRPQHSGTLPQRLAQLKQTPPLSQPLIRQKIQSLFINFHRPIIRFQEQHSGDHVVHFLVPFLQEFELLFQFQFSQRCQPKNIRFRLIQGGRLSLLTYNQAIRSFCKTVASLNLNRESSPFTFEIDLRSSQIGGKAALKWPGLDNKSLFLQIKALIVKSQSVMKEFIVRFLYNHRPNGLRFLRDHGSRQTKELFLGHQGLFKAWLQIKELLPFINNEIQASEEATATRGRSSYPILTNPSNRLDQAFNQHKQLERQLWLFSFNSYLENDQPVSHFINKETLANQLVFPTPFKALPDQHFQNLKNINIFESFPKRENILKNGLKAKVSIFAFKYKQILNRGQQNPELKPRQSYLVVKQASKKQPGKQMAIKYEKQVVQQLCDSYCAYIPTYYQAKQENSAYKDCLLMEFINSYNLHQVVQTKRYFFGMPSKLKLLVHLSNALRFLDKKQVVHIDLSPGNVMVVDDLSVKLIDFGQAYSPKLCKKYNDSTFKYRPCKTFPYSSPQAYCRSKNFTFQQDIFSLGAIAFKMFFGYYHLNCSQKTLEKVYKSKQYIDRIFFAYQITTEYANNDYLCILAFLIFRMLDVEQKRRPLVSWVHLLLKRLFNMATK